MIGLFAASSPTDIERHDDEAGMLLVGILYIGTRNAPVVIG